MSHNYTSTLKRKGVNLIISAPSGVGKSTIIQNLIANDPNLSFSISATTRPKRNKEVDGTHYYFKTKEEFYNLIKTNSFIEYVEVFGNFYGTLTETVTSKLDSGVDLIFDLDWQGANILKKKMPSDCISIFILPPSIEELERRIRTRCLDSEDTILHRMSKARSEMSHYHEYDYIIINDELESAIAEIKAIISSSRHLQNKFFNIENFVNNL